MTKSRKLVVTCALLLFLFTLCYPPGYPYPLDARNGGHQNTNFLWVYQRDTPSDPSVNWSALVLEWGFIVGVTSLVLVWIRE